MPSKKALCEYKSSSFPTGRLRRWKLQSLPVSIAQTYRRIFLAGRFSLDNPFSIASATSACVGPDVSEIDRLPCPIHASASFSKLCRSCRPERRPPPAGGLNQVIGPHVHIHAALEVSIAAQHADCNQPMLVECF